MKQIRIILVALLLLHSLIASAARTEKTDQDFVCTAQAESKDHSLDSDLISKEKSIELALKALSKSCETLSLSSKAGCQINDGKLASVYKVQCKDSAGKIVSSGQPQTAETGTGSTPNNPKPGPKERDWRDLELNRPESKEGDK